MPKIHPREHPVLAATSELRSLVAKWMGKNPDLTTFELLQVVNGVLYSEMSGILKYAIREERHGDTNKPGGWA